VIRIGGNSQDALTAVPGPLVFQRLAALHATLGVRYILGVRLKGGYEAFAQQQVTAALRYLPEESILAFEVSLVTLKTVSVEC
jgi:hypothetical protein